MHNAKYNNRKYNNNDSKKINNGLLPVMLWFFNGRKFGSKTSDNITTITRNSHSEETLQNTPNGCWVIAAKVGRPIGTKIMLVHRNVQKQASKVSKLRCVKKHESSEAESATVSALDIKNKNKHSKIPRFLGANEIKR